jgi:hypothetical protein
MTSIEVPDWVVRSIAGAMEDWHNNPANETGYNETLKAALTAALGAWVVREGYIAGPELRGLDAARQLGTKFYGTVWSDPTGQAGTPLFTLRQEKPE